MFQKRNEKNGIPEEAEQLIQDMMGVLVPDLICVSKVIEKGYPGAGRLFLVRVAQRMMELTGEAPEQEGAEAKAKGGSEFAGRVRGLQRWIREQLPYAPNDAWTRKLREASVLLNDLLEELEDERYRHDRVQDFCTAEGRLLRKAKEDLRDISACHTCTAEGCGRMGDKPPAPENGCGGYKWDSGVKDRDGVEFDYGAED